METQPQTSIVDRTDVRDHLFHLSDKKKTHNDGNLEGITATVTQLNAIMHHMSPAPGHTDPCTVAASEGWPW